MPVILPDLKSLKKLQRQTRVKKGRAVRPPPKSEADLKRRLAEMWKKVLLPATDYIKELIASNASPAAIAEAIEQMLRKANSEYAIYANDISDKWKMSLDRETRQMTTSSLKAALGIDVTTILETPEIKDALAIGGMEAANLIKSIPGEHLGKVAQAVADNFAGVQDMPLTKKIQEIGGVTERRARIIARDQTSKMTGNLNRVRQQSIGIEEYVWKTAKDNRVVGNPNGVSPTGNRRHMDHWKREGKTYRWDSPPPDGHPGQAIMCRCYASPIIDPVKVAEMARES
jgi:SPP1 gp7 family putative phage head morphogenesis protein